MRLKGNVKSIIYFSFIDLKYSELLFNINFKNVINIILQKSIPILSVC